MASSRSKNHNFEEPQPLWSRVKDLSEGDLILRREIWLRHGHDGLYGDDGEMQCARCGIDFKRDPAHRIASGLHDFDVQRFAKETADKGKST